MKTENRIAKYIDDHKRETDREELEQWRNCVHAHVDERMRIVNLRVRQAELFEARAMLYLIVATAALVIAIVSGGC